jgi:hypothetical protein
MSIVAGVDFGTRIVRAALVATNQGKLGSVLAAGHVLSRLRRIAAAARGTT